MKPTAEQQFLYGNHVLKSGLGRITENTAKYQGVVVYSMTDVPLVSKLHIEFLSTEMDVHIRYTKIVILISNKHVLIDCYRVLVLLLNQQQNVN